MLLVCVCTWTLSTLAQPLEYIDMSVVSTLESSSCYEVSITIEFDSFPFETSWDIFVDGEYYDSQSGAFSPSMTTTWSLCGEKIQVKMYDSYGDGFDGSIVVRLGDGIAVYDFDGWSGYSNHYDVDLHECNSEITVDFIGGLSTSVSLMFSGSSQGFASHDGIPSSSFNVSNVCYGQYVLALSSDDAFSADVSIDSVHYDNVRMSVGGESEVEFCISSSSSGACDSELSGLGVFIALFFPISLCICCCQCRRRRRNRELAKINRGDVYVPDRSPGVQLEQIRPELEPDYAPRQPQVPAYEVYGEAVSSSGIGGSIGTVPPAYIAPENSHNDNVPAPDYMY